MLNKLRKAHAEGEIWAGVDVQKEGVSNNFEAFVWEPALVKINAIQAASEAATSVLSVSHSIVWRRLCLILGRLDDQSAEIDQSLIVC